MTLMLASVAMLCFGTPAVGALSVGPAAGAGVVQHRRLANLGRRRTSLGSSVVNEIDSLYQTFPMQMAFVTCGVKAAAADVVAQQKESIGCEDDDDIASIAATGGGLQIDGKRNFSFIMYGGLYQGIAQLILYNRIFPWIFGDGTDLATVASKVLFDNLFISPFVCLPVAYLLKSVVFQYTVEEAKARYIEDVKDGLICKYWSFWVPAQSLTFSVIPPHLRILFVAAVSFFWLVVFSTISSRQTSTADKEL
ncbi:hypothetical protein ACHAWF_013808 [Thalassiosira exigua]